MTKQYINFIFSIISNNMAMKCTFSIIKWVAIKSSKVSSFLIIFYNAKQVHSKNYLGRYFTYNSNFTDNNIIHQINITLRQIIKIITNSACVRLYTYNIVCVQGVDTWNVILTLIPRPGWSFQRRKNKWSIGDTRLYTHYLMSLKY